MRDARKKLRLPQEPLSVLRASSELVVEELHRDRTVERVLNGAVDGPISPVSELPLKLKDQGQQAAESIVLNIAEGSGRRQGKGDAGRTIMTSPWVLPPSAAPCSTSFTHWTAQQSSRRTYVALAQCSRR